MATYKVVPFRGKLKNGQDASDVSLQLQELINQNASQGWELEQVQGIDIQVAPGCLAAFLGAKDVYARYDQVIFRKP